MVGKIIQRAVLGELIRVFFMALLSITGLILLASVIAEAMRSGLGPGQILAALPLFIPNMLPYTLPTTTLFATCIVYGRLSADNEILALKAAGIHMVNVVWPAMLIGTFSACFTFGLYLYAIPISQYLLKQQILADPKGLFFAALRKDGHVQQPQLDWVFFVKGVNGDRLIDAQIMHKDPKGKGFDLIILAKEAQLDFNFAQKQVLLIVKDALVVKDAGREVFFANRIFPLEMPSVFNMAGLNKTRPMDMTWLELFSRLAESRQEMEKYALDQKAHEESIARGNAPQTHQTHVDQLSVMIRYQQATQRNIIAEMHMRGALAVGCLCFVLIGCPVGIWFSRSDYLSAFITCFLPIIIFYYPVMLATISMAKSGRQPMEVIWIADAAMVLVSIPMYWRLVRT